ncbi:choice-of-anchor Q domain-containing protein, partial [Microcoleus sp. N9_B4]|uniref:choice-of-anchor Q domain-containing protein n=1 Tax=Microcoleus sp. N9_B4 TaxID=3055386 RepID=UPI002FD5B6E3
MATVIVTTLDDLVDGTTTNITTLNATPGGAGISLREAIAAANNTAGADTIDLTGVAGTILLTNASGALPITDSVTINGPGASNLTVSGNNAVQVFNISGAGTTANIDSITIANGRIITNGGGIAVGTGSTLNLSNSTVSGNRATGAPAANGKGGGIYNNGTLTVTNSTISGNSATFNGGGINNFGGTVTVTNSTISGNSATLNGGGLHNNTSRRMDIIDSTISGNSAANNGGGIFSNFLSTLNVTNSTISGNSTNGSGGGIYSLARPATITNSTISGNSANFGGGGIVISNSTAFLNNSTISGNTANSNGGGVYNFTSTTTLSNSTISGNSAANNGGGIISNNGTANLNNSTVTNNTADRDNNGAGDGGGIFRQAGTFNVQNTIVAGNFDTPNNAGSGTINPDVSGTFTDNGNNLIGIDQGSGSFVNGTNGNIVGTFATPVNPQLAALANNGGLTQTHALVSGSPAIDAGTNPNSLTTDQRGTGFPRVVGSAADIGAYELPSDIAISTANSSQAEGNSGTTNFTFTVTRTLNTSGISTANYTVTASGANPANTTDFGGNFPSGTVTFNNGDTTQTITIPVSGDNTIEPDEDFTVTLSTPSSGTIISTATATGTIQNDDTVDLNITLSDSPDPVTLGNPLTYTLTVNNTGNADATGVDAEFTLPTGLSIVGTPTVSNGFTYAGTTGGVAKFTGGSINASSNATLTLDVTPNSAVTLTSGTAVVDPNNTITESDETNNTATAVTTTVNAPTVNLSVSSNAGTEVGTTVITVTATASSAVSSNQTVDLGISGTNIIPGDYNLANTTITIPSGQTTGATTFTVVDDALVEGTETATLTINNPTSGIVLGSTTTQNIDITDNDVAGVTITQSGNSTDITEGGTTDSYTVVLNSQPTNDVTIAINSDSQSTSSASTLTFTSANWNVAQTVTVTALDDNLVEGNHTSTINYIASSSDTNYNAIAITPVTANITDNDTAGVTISQSGNSTDISEGGTTDSYTVVLNSQPTNDVTIAINSDSQSTSSASTLTFTSANWNVAQTVTVTAVDDSLVEGNHTSTISYAASSSDTNYNAIAITPVTANITDNDVAPNPTVNLSVSSNVGNEAGTTAITVTATTSSAVSSNQTVNLGISGTNITTGDYNLGDTSITIPSGQTTGITTFTIIDDALVEGTETATLTISNPTSGITLGSTTFQDVVITDNDIPTPTPIPTPSVTPTPIPTPSVTPTPIPTPSVTPTPIPTPSVTPTPIPTPSVTPTPIPTPSVTPTPIPT